MSKISTLLFLTALLFIGCSSSSKNNQGFSVTRSAGSKTLVVRRPLTKKYTITQRFKPKRNRSHKGIDLAGKKGDPILAMSDGRIIYKGNRFSGYGNMVLIEHAFGISTLYSHLSRIYVSAGQYVKSGETIGEMGETGRTTGVHLHFEVMENKVPVNPEKYVRF